MERRMKNIIESLSDQKLMKCPEKREHSQCFDKNNKELSINSIEIFLEIMPQNHYLNYLQH